MRYIYRIRTDTVNDEDGNFYIVYGIEALNISGAVIKSVPDVFFDYKKAYEFVKRCNTCKLSLVHLMDVIEDEIG